MQETIMVDRQADRKRKVEVTGKMPSCWEVERQCGTMYKADFDDVLDDVFDTKEMDSEMTRD